MNITTLTAVLFLSVTPLINYGQGCPNWTPIKFHNQAGIDDFLFYYPNCTEIDGDLYIQGSQNTGSDITDLSPLGNLTNITGSLTIEYNNNLFSLNGLNNITHLGGSLIAQLNIQLTDLDGLSGLGSVDENVFFYANHNLANIDGIKDLGSMAGDFTFYYNNAIVNFPSFENIQSIGGKLRIEDNAQLKNMNGFGNVKQVGGDLIINSNADMDTIFGHPMIKTVGGNAEIYNNGMMQTLTGLDSLSEIGGYFQIEYNISLEDIGSLQNLKSVGGHLEISSNEELKSLHGLDKLEKIDGNLEISFNSKISDLMGIRNIDPNSISNNSLWNDTDLIIIHNDQLSDCAVQSICELLILPDKIIDITWNNTGCNSQEEVMDACNPSHSNDDKLKEISIYPNPTQGEIYIEFSAPDPDQTCLNLTGLSGKVIKSWVREFSEDKMKVSISEIPTGTYFLNLISNGQVLHHKIVVLN